MRELSENRFISILRVQFDYDPSELKVEEDRLRLERERMKRETEEYELMIREGC